MAYDEMHRSFIQYHIDNRKFERRGRLVRGHGHAEALFLRNVWQPLRGDFHHLHPEYEVIDWRGRSYFADFAWLQRHLQIDHKTAVILLQKLCVKGWLLPSYSGNRARVVRYELARDFLGYFD